MEMLPPKGSGANQDKAIAVAVKKSRNSQLALKWTVENLMKESQSLTIVHVRHKDCFRRGNDELKYGEMEAFCGPEVAKGLEQAYKENLLRQSREIFNPMQAFCKKKNVRCEEVLLEDDSVPQALADFVLENNFDVLVLGAGSKGGILRKLKGPDTATKISKIIPYFCAVYTVYKGGVISLKSPSSASLSPSPSCSVLGQEPEIGVQSPTSQMENRISVSGGALLQPNHVNDFEFRSPLKDCRDSDFTWIGQCPSETDISFIGPDRLFDSHESPRFPNSSPGCLQGSFNYSGASNSPQKTLLEPLAMKEVNGTASREDFAMRLLALKTKYIQLEENEGLMQDSQMAVARIRNDRVQTA